MIDIVLVHLPALAGAALLDVLEERVVLGVAVAHHLHVDLFLVANVEDDVAVLLVLFDFLVGGFADVGNGHAGRLAFGLQNKQESKDNHINIYKEAFRMRIIFIQSVFNGARPV